MPSRSLRILVLVSALPLALPTSWCCVLPLPQPCCLAKAADRECSCCHAKPAGKPAPAPAPTPPRGPMGPGGYPCLTWNATTPASPKAPGLDLSLPAPQAVPPLPPAAAGGPDVARPDAPPPGVARNLLHCVWLC
jgi:hypothetical protein